MHRCPKHWGTSSSPLPPQGSPPRMWATVGGCQVVQAHSPFSLMPAPPGAQRAPWGIAPAGRGLQSPCTYQEPPYLLKVLVIEGYLGRSRLPHTGAVVRGFLIRWRGDEGELAWGVWGM